MFSFVMSQERLWAALASGELDMVVSDHSPCSPELKQMGEGEGNFLSAWGGISSLQFGTYNEFLIYTCMYMKEGKNITSH
jgi:dihydroorotase-like cyclic amidohydrolase